MKPRKLGLPWSMQIELVEGCTRLCNFCGLNAIRDAPGTFKYMTIGTAQRLARQIESFNPNMRLEFAMHGEPLAHPKADEIFAIFRKQLPTTQIMLTTNGNAFTHGRMAKRVERLWKAGVDYIILDTYYPERDALRDEAFALPESVAIVKDFYDELAPAGWSPWHNHRRKIQYLIILMDDLAVRSGEVRSRVICNEGGNTPQSTKRHVAKPLPNKCTLPFREIAVTWNGDINICCMDWGSELCMGNVGENSLETLDSVWHGQRFQAVRRMLYAKQRTYSPCNRCDYKGGGRVGLLPNMDSPTDGDRDLINHIMINAEPNNRLPRQFIYFGENVLNLPVVGQHTNALYS